MSADPDEDCTFAISNQGRLQENQSTLGQGNPSHSSAPNPVAQGMKIKMPSMAPFDDKVDSMDAYIDHFEGMAADAEWKKSFWVGALATLLKGRALEIYHGLSPQQHSDFDSLNEMINEGLILI